jgi:hypothetical protein
MIGLVGRDICRIKGIDTGPISIDVDKAGLYPATPAMVSVDGSNVAQVQADGTLLKAGTGVDVDGRILTHNSMHFRSWAIYPTRDPTVWYQMLGNLDPAGFLRAFGLNPEAGGTRDEAYARIRAVTIQLSAAELELKCMEHGFCGQTCYTPAQWRETNMGKRLAEHPVIEVMRKGSPTHDSNANLPPVPFPVPAGTEGDQRPLTGIKVVELARVVAGPALGAALASLGADVIHVFSPSLHDLQPLALSLTAGKRTCALDLTVAADRERLRDLIKDADVVVQAFRQGALERKGFGLDQVLDMAVTRAGGKGKGIVYVDLSCYGLAGYYAERPGFQQIADAASGCSYVCGKAYGFPEGTAVLPPLPVADMLSGAVGVIDVLLALRDRALVGGSYHASVALTALDTIQLTREVGLWPPSTVRKVQEKFRFAAMTPDLHVEELLYVLGDAWAKAPDQLLARDGYMVNFETVWATQHAILSPVVQYENTAASPRWDHGPVPYLLDSRDIKWL